MHSILGRQIEITGVNFSQCAMAAICDHGHPPGEAGGTFPGLQMSLNCFGFIHWSRLAANQRMSVAAGGDICSTSDVN